MNVFASSTPPFVQDGIWMDTSTPENILYKWTANGWEPLVEEEIIKAIDVFVDKSKLVNVTGSNVQEVLEALDKSLNNYYTRTQTNNLLNNKANQSTVDELTKNKQDVLIEGTNIEIKDNVISAKIYDDTAITDLIGTKVSKSGDTMTGPLYLSGNPSEDMMAVNRRFLAEQLANLESTALTFVGFVSPTEPSQDIREGNFWYQGAITDALPWQVKTYTSGIWSDTTTEYIPDAMDLWNDLSKEPSDTYFYIGQEWQHIDFNGSTFDPNKFEVIDGVVYLKPNSIANGDIADNANISQSKINNLTTDLSKKLDNVAVANKLYGTDNSSNQVTYDISQSVSGGAVVQRDTNGSVLVPYGVQGDLAVGARQVSNMIDEAVGEVSGITDLSIDGIGNALTGGELSPDGTELILHKNQTFAYGNASGNALVANKLGSPVIITDFTTFNPSTLGLNVGEMVIFNATNANGKPYQWSDCFGYIQRNNSSLYIYHLMNGPSLDTNKALPIIGIHSNGWRGWTYTAYGDSNGNALLALNSNQLGGINANQYVTKNRDVETNLNNITNGGMYQIGTNAGQPPGSISYGNLLVLRNTGDSIYQLYGDRNGNLFVRGESGANVTSGTLTAPWRQIIDSTNGKYIYGDNERGTIDVNNGRDNVIKSGFYLDGNAGRLFINIQAQNTPTYNYQIGLNHFSQNSPLLFRQKVNNVWGTERTLIDSSNTQWTGMTTLYNFMSGSKTITSLSNLVLDKQIQYANLSANQTLSVSSRVVDGQPTHFYIQNTSTNPIVVTLPNTDNYVSFSGTELEVVGNGYAEISIAYDTNISKYRIIALTTE